MKPQGTFKIRGNWGSDYRWLGDTGWWYSESKAMEFTLEESRHFTLPVGGEWVFIPLQTKDDNNEEKMDVSNRGDGSDDNSVTN